LRITTYFIKEPSALSSQLSAFVFLVVELSE